MSDESRGPTAPVPYRVWDRWGRILGPHAISVLGYLIRLGWQDGVCWPHPATVARATGMSERRAEQALSLLARHGWIGRAPIPPNVRTRLRSAWRLLNPPDPPEGSDLWRRQEGAGPAPVKAQDLRPESADRAPCKAQAVRFQGADPAPRQRGIDSTGEGEGTPSPKGADPAPSPEAPGSPADELGRLWLSLSAQRRQGKPAEALDDVTAALAELLRQGVPAELLRLDIEGPLRDRTEFMSAFRDRWRRRVPRIRQKREADDLRRRVGRAADQTAATAGRVPTFAELERERRAARQGPAPPVQ